MRPSRFFSPVLSVRARALFFGALAACAAIASTNCGDGDTLPDGGDSGPEGGTSGGGSSGGGSSGGSSGGSTTAGDAGDAGDASDAADGARDGGDAGDGEGGPSATARALEWTVTPTGLDAKRALGSTYDSTNKVYKPDICLTGTQKAQNGTATSISSFGTPTSGSEFLDTDLDTQYLPFPGRAWIPTYKTVVARPPSGSRWLRSQAFSGDQYYIDAPETRTAATDCGDQVVGSYTAERVYSVVVTVWPDDSRSVMPVFGIDGVFDPTSRASIETALVNADAHIAFHVLDGTAHQTAIEDILRASTCKTSDLTACKATYDALLPFGAAPAAATDDNFAALPGVDWPLNEPGTRVLPP
jgi:hypothetical protein